MANSKAGTLDSSDSRLKKSKVKTFEAGILDSADGGARDAQVLPLDTLIATP